MSAAIANVIYGIPLNEIIMDAAKDLYPGDWDPDDPTSYGFETLYTASGYRHVGYCGVKLASFSEGNDFWVKDIPQPTDEQKHKVWDLIKQIPQPLRETMPPPGLCIVWSNS